jgi:hydroxymethylglutaryl-CoA reductase (NADPH)
VIKKQSFYISDKNISETEKVEIRRKLVSQLVNKNSSKFKDLYNTNFPTETVGKKNCENLIGSVEVPVGIAGPVTTQINQVFNDLTISKKSKKSYLIPLATTEGALVASIHRGLKVLNVGETKVIVKKVGMSRSVVFECDSIESAAEFNLYFSKNTDLFAKFCEETSNHLKFLSYEVLNRDKLLYYRFVFDTDEAMGMNMVTIALSYAWDKFKRQLPDNIWVSLLTVSGNVCTDKKDSMINRLRGRGYYVTIESKILLSDVEKYLKVNPKKLVKTHLVKNVIGSNVAGSFSQNMHVANALGAFYLAIGQDIAHLVAGSEASVHFEILESNELYVALTLPNISVGSVGGGTWLPKQTQARLAMMLVKDKNQEQMPTAQDLAIVAGLAALAGEVSGLAALTTNTLASSHEKLGRTKKD